MKSIREETTFSIANDHDDDGSLDDGFGGGGGVVLTPALLSIGMVEIRRRRRLPEDAVVSRNGDPKLHVSAE